MVCGGGMVDRPSDVVRAELMHVLWVMEEVPLWDATTVAAAARRYVVDRYKRQEYVLRETLKVKMPPLAERKKPASESAAIAHEATASAPTASPPTAHAATVSAATASAPTAHAATAHAATAHAATAHAATAHAASAPPVSVILSGGEAGVEGSRVPSAPPSEAAASSNVSSFDSGFASAQDDVEKHANSTARDGSTHDVAQHANSTARDGSTHDVAQHANSTARNGSTHDVAPHANSTASTHDAAQHANSTSRSRRTPPPSPEEFARSRPSSSPVAALLATESAPTPEDRVVEEASSWSRVWKPFLNESVGWFIGAFLILAGTLYWVSDAWHSMSQSTQAMTVFGLAGVWTMGFAAWAKFLDRREVTRSAARVVKLIAAAVSPLAPVALGAIVHTAPLLVYPALLAWSAFTFVLARSVTRDFDPLGNPFTPIAMVLTTAIMGLAPQAIGLGVSCIWLTTLPLLAMFASSWRGPRETGRHTAFALFAPLSLLALFATRLAVAAQLAHTQFPLAHWAPFLAGAVASLLWLRKPKRAADPLAISVVALLTALMGVSVLAQAPGFFIVSALLCAVGLHLAFQRVTASSRWWLVAAYAGAHFAFQSMGQLVPGVVMQLVASVKTALGYAEGTLPASYDAVYAAIYVVAVAFVALWQQRSKSWLRLTESEVLITCTGWASALIGALGMASLTTDARPALWSTPVLAALCLFLGIAQNRRLLTAIGSGLVLAFAAAIGITLRTPFDGLAIAALGAVAAGGSIFLTRDHRTPMRVIAITLGIAAVAFGWATPLGFGGLLTLIIGAATLLLLARDIDHHVAMVVAGLIAASIPLRATMWLAPGFEWVALAVTAIALAAIARREGRWSTASVASAVAALGAPLLQISAQSASAFPLLGAVLLLSGIALVLAREGWRDAVAITFFAGATMTMPQPFTTWPFLTGAMSSGLAIVAALAASVWAARNGRSWRVALIACCAVAVSIASVGTVLVSLTSQTEISWYLAAAAITALLSSRALLPSVTVPISAAFALFAGIPFAGVLVPVAIGFSALALFEEWHPTWSLLLGKRPIAWAASLSALTLAIAATASMLIAGQPSAMLVGGVLFAALSLVWLRATRFVGFAVLVPVGLAMIDHTARPMWLAPIAVVVLTRLLARVPAIGAFFVGPRDAEKRTGWLRQVLVFSLAFIGTAMIPTGPMATLPFCLALMFSAAEPAAARIVVAAGLSLAMPHAVLIATLLLLALAFTSRLAPRAASLLLGAETTVWTVGSAVMAALGCATVNALLHPTAFSSPLLVGACLLSMALLLSWRWVLVPAVLAFAFPIALVSTQTMPLSQAVISTLVIAFAATLAASARESSFATALEKLGTRLGTGWAGPLSTPLWLGALLGVASLVVVMAAGGGGVPVLLVATAALLVVTPVAIESGFGAWVLVMAVAVATPAPYRSMAVAAVGFALCGLSAWLESSWASTRVLHHIGWVAALFSVVAMPGLQSIGTPVTLTLGFATAWLVARRRPSLEWAAWLTTLIAGHVWLFFAGVSFSTGQPHELILPWVGCVSLVLGAIAMSIAPTTQRRAIGSGGHHAGPARDRSRGGDARAAAPA